MNYNVSNMYNYATQYPLAYNMLANSNYLHPTNILESATHEVRNRYVYINQNFINPNTGFNTKVLINPNFKQTVHINPNFKKPSIHVNPNVLKLNDNNSVIRLNVQNTSSKDSSDTNWRKPQPIVSTRTKLVRATNTEKSRYDFMNHERQKSVHTKYKIIHSNGSSEDNFNSGENCSRYRYKVDNISNAKKLLKKGTVKSRYSIQNIGITKKRKSNSKYISINGILYKKTPNVLKKADLVKITSGKTNIIRSKILKIRGKFYKLDHQQKRLKMIPITLNSSVKLNLKCNNITQKQRRLHTSRKLVRSKNRILSSDTKNRVIQILRSNMKKCNLPCPMYRKFGKCKGHELGRCIRVHNPDQVMLCARFVQGACLNSKCLLSHKVSPEKMPTCKYFLEGRCTKEDCIYLHVKISAKADICKDFLEGYCKKAKECDKRHQLLCPDYEKNSTCPRKRCQYPHGNLVRKTKYTSKVAKRIFKKKCPAKGVKRKIANADDDHEQLDKNVRYYIENSEKDVKADVVDIISENVLKNEQVVGDFDKSSDLKLLKRAQLGVLPSYIPFGGDSVPCEIEM